jgi:hypothetical protein
MTIIPPGIDVDPQAVEQRRSEQTVPLPPRPRPVILRLLSNRSSIIGSAGFGFSRRRYGYSAECRAT